MVDGGDTAREALHSRLLAAAPHILPGAESHGLPPMELLARLSEHVRADGSHSLCWLLVTAVAGAMPTRDQVLEAFRQLQLSAPSTGHYAILQACAGLASINGNVRRPMSIVTGVTAIDVDFSSQFGHNTGIQRVVRETVSRWSRSQELLLLAWTIDGLMTRSLVPSERARVIDWTSDRILEHSTLAEEDEAELVIPWDSTLVLPEVAQHRVWEALSCFAEFSTNRIVAIGYDAIPVTSAEYVIPSETDRFVRYLSIVKHVDVVVGISESSSCEFQGFLDSLNAQGQQSGRVVTVSLPVALASSPAPLDIEPRASQLPLVVCVGTQEPRKNQLAVLAAAEETWRQGIPFELLFIGSAAMPLSIPFDVELDRLHRAGRPVSVIRNGSDRVLEQAYRDAAFSVFISLHEGYGLPVGESLAAGTPVIATGYGSIAEIAMGGGCLLVDPRDDQQVATAMATLLTDESALAALRQQARSRVLRSWDDYARELWETVESA